MPTSPSNKTPSFPLPARRQARSQRGRSKGQGELYKGTQTPFAQLVYSIVSKIPKGKTLSYKQVAIAAGRPNSARAIGNIMNKNRDPRVPCHRVIKSDGSVGGYALGGTSNKQKILKREGAI